MSRVFNFITQKEIFYDCEPRKAVVAAYAQSKNDWNTWTYEEKYDHLVLESEIGFYLNEFACLKEN